MKHYAVDLCIVGAGSAGLSLAAGAAQLGLSVVLFEAGEMGGDCLNSGCVPSKALIAAASQAQAMRDAAVFGIEPCAPKVDWHKVKAHVKSVIASIAPNDSQERFEGLGVIVVRERASFENKRTLVSRTTRVEADRIVIATGSRAAIPPIPGIDSASPLTNETIFDVDSLPRHLIVLGAGAIGVELGQAFRRLGSEVTIVEAKSALSAVDREAAELVLARLAKEGVEVLEGWFAQMVVRVDGNVALALTNGRGASRALEGSHLLVAAGRTPNLQNLRLEAGEVAFDRSGVITGANLRSRSNPRVWALGDAVGGTFTHTAGWHASVFVLNALFKARTQAAAVVQPAVIYSDPELAQVGLTEQQARERFGAGVKIARWGFEHNDRAAAQRDSDGFCKLVLGGGGKILGATIVGAEAGELIGAIALAMSAKLGVRALTSPVLPYPTRGEIWKRAAGAHFAPTLFSPITRALVNLSKRIP